MWGEVLTVLQMKACQMEEKYIGVVAREATAALNYLHNQGIIHRDLKGAV